MSEPSWKPVDALIERTLIPSDEALAAALRASTAAGLPESRSPQGRASTCTCSPAS